MNEKDALICLGAWLGAVLDRLRRGGPPIPSDAGESQIEELAMGFGANWKITVSAWSYTRVARIPALDSMLIEIHTRARNQPWEEPLWEYGILLYVPTPLPVAIAHDFIDRNIARRYLSHSWQEESVWWRLVGDEDPEAVYNIAYYRYTRSEDDWYRVEEVLHQFPWSDLLFKLAREKPSSPEKARGLAERIRAHPDRLDILRPARSLNPTFVTAWLEVAGREAVP